jgi:hypothetical protein
MKYVLDSNVALKWVLAEADSGRAVRLRDEYSNGIHELVAPDIFPSEIANGLASAQRQLMSRMPRIPVTIAGTPPSIVVGMAASPRIKLAMALPLRLLRPDAVPQSASSASSDTASHMLTCALCERYPLLAAPARLASSLLAQWI